MVRQLEAMGTAALAYKRIIYDRLPQEVLDFAEKKNFPIFSIDRKVWFENIIFDIMYAVQFDDKVYLAEDKINAMLSSHMSRSELDIILKGISLKMCSYITVTCMTQSAQEWKDSPDATFDAGRILRSFYMMKGYRSKALLVRYEDSLFLITTSAKGDLDSHRRIVEEGAQLFSLPAAAIVGMSEVHPQSELDEAFREARMTALAAEAEGKTLSSKTLQIHTLAETGAYRIILPALEHPQTAAFADSVLRPLAESEDLRETADEYVSAGGDLAKSATALHCHVNTVRYRLGRIREQTGLTGLTDADFYMHLKLALLIERAGRVRA